MQAQNDFVMPPSMSRNAPLKKPARFEARNTQAAAMSSGVPGGPSGMSAKIPRRGRPTVWRASLAPLPGKVRPAVERLEEGDQPLAEVAPEVEALRAVVDRGQRPELHRAVVGVGDLEPAHPAVPQRVGLAEPGHLPAEGLDRQAVVGVDLDRDEHLRRAPGPVLEGLRQDARHRDDEPSIVPAPHDHVGEEHLLDGAPLLVDDDGVAEAELLGARPRASCEHDHQGPLVSAPEAEAGDPDAPAPERTGPDHRHSEPPGHVSAAYDSGSRSME